MEGSDALSLSDAERKFEFYDIVWLVENFRLLLCREYWAIKSPELVTRKPRNTKWVMVLRSRSDLDEREVLFILRRLDDDSEYENVWVNFRVHVTYADHTNYMDSKLHCFGKTSQCSMLLKSKQYYFEALNPFKPDVLEVGCEMIIYSERTSEGFKACSYVGLKSLSEDLLNLFDVKPYHDVALKFEGGTILAHEAMIYARCKTLFDYIEKKTFVTETELSKKVHEVDFKAFSYEAMRQILRYLYSGDLKHVLEKPLVAVYDCAIIFKISEIKNAYNPERLIFRTSVEVDKFTFNWNIVGFMEKHGNNPLSSPVLTETEFGTKWQLHLYPRSQGDSDYVAVFAEIFHEIIVLDACLEFGIADDSGRYFFLKTLECSDKASKKWGYMKFARRDLLESYTIGGVLRVIFRLQLTYGNRNTVFERQVSAFKTNLKENFTFRNLSLDLESLCDSGRFCDGFLSSEGVIFPIHKCILAARSSTFDRMLSNMHGVDEIRDISGMVKSEILCDLLNYIYTGILPHYLEAKELADLHKAAVTFKLRLLRTFCAEVFEDAED